MLGTLVYDLLVILAAGLVAGVVCRRLHTSVLIGYLLAGALLGQGMLGLVSHDRHEIEYFAEAGVFLLLFSIGLEFSLDELIQLGRNLLIGGSAQMLAVALPIGVMLIVLGWSWQPAVLIAAAVSFSSTVLVFKVLSEWGHSSLPHGRRAIGILLFQDAALIPLLLLVPLLTDTGESVGLSAYLVLAITSVLFIAAVVALRYILGKWIIPIFAGYRSPDLIILFTVVALGGVTYGAHRVGLPPAIGAFAAGLIFSGNRWTRQIDALILPFRETFSAVFFVSLGLLFDARAVMNEPMLLGGCLVALIAIKATAATVALRLTGLRFRAAMGMGVGLAHIGEFAFVLVMLGWEAGVLSSADYQRIVALAIGSLILTPVMLRTGLRWTQSSVAGEDHTPHAILPDQLGHQAIVVGAGPIGRQVAAWFETLGKDVCLVDLSPVNLHAFAQQGIRTVAGDAADRDILDLAHASGATIVVICVPHDETAVRVVREVRAMNPACYVLVRCRYRENIVKLMKSGASRVVSEELEAGDAMLRMLVELNEREAIDESGSGGSQDRAD